jgi:hypothetical protein
MPKGVGYGGTQANKSIAGKTHGRSGTAAGSAAASGSAKKSSSRRTGGSTNSARQAKQNKQGT